MRLFTISVFATILSFSIQAQDMAFGLKGGLSLGSQKWNSYERDPLIAYHGIVFVESAEETNSFGVFSQLGYHQKGSAIRGRNFLNPINGEFTRPPAQEFIFHNLSLVVGGKKKLEFSGNAKLYYLFGMRGDYTLTTNLDEYEEINQFSGFFPFPQFVQRWNYGVTVGGGIEFPFTDLIGAIIEFTANPDFSAQYRQPPLNLNVINPWNSPGNQTPIGERVIRNLTFEISIGFRFLRKVIYID